MTSSLSVIIWRCKEAGMNCFEIQVRGASFKIWAPTVQDAVETFMIDMDVLEVPSELATYHSDQVPMFPAECGGF